MPPKHARRRARDTEMGFHNLLGVPGPAIKRSEENRLWERMRIMPGGKSVQANIYQISHIIEQRPWARLHLANVEARINDVFLRAAYSIFMWQSHIAAMRGPNLDRVIATPPCRWCGLPTGCFCDGCHGPVCTTCDERFSMCRQSHLAMQ